MTNQLSELQAEVNRIFKEYQNTAFNGEDENLYDAVILTRLENELKSVCSKFYSPKTNQPNMTKAEQLSAKLNEFRVYYKEKFGTILSNRWLADRVLSMCTESFKRGLEQGYSLRDQEVSEGLYTKKETIFFADHVLREEPQDIFADDKSSLLEIDKLHKEYFQDEQPDICTLISQRFTSSDMVKFAEWISENTVKHTPNKNSMRWHRGNIYTTTDLLKIFNELNEGV